MVHGFRLATIAMLLLLPSACLGSGARPIPGGPSQTPAQGGSLVLNLTDFGWVNVAIPANVGMKRDDFGVRVSFIFNSPAATPAAMLEYKGLPFDGRDGGAPSEAGLCVYGNVERAAGRTCGKVPAWSDGTDGSMVASYAAKAPDFGIKNPVFHYFLAVMEAHADAPTALVARWSNATANVTYGAAKDAFLLRPSAFATQADGSRTASVQVPPGRTIGFNMRMPPTYDTAGAIRPYYERPNGTRQELRFGDGREYAQQAGTWVFHLPAGYPPDPDDVPEVWGAVFNRAEVS